MRILIFHYHLNPGGVTRIIESQVLGLKKQFPNLELVVVSGACENPDFFTKMGVHIFTNPIINYLFEKDFTTEELLEIENNMQQFLQPIIQPNDILHVHNLNLGKNPVFTKMMLDYHKKGFLLINHAHDFAEDRSANWAYLKKIFSNHYQLPFPESLYPKSENYKVVVLNRFDFERVKNYKIAKDTLYLLPNPVFIPTNLKSTKIAARNKLVKQLALDSEKIIITYPVRVIRRKNIGELILLAVLLKDTCQFLVTLPPKNPVEIDFYQQWIAFCKAQQISIVFEAGLHADFENVLQGSDYCITTSIKEGFGMSFLEPWTFETPVIGRNLKSVTRDITDAGVDFPLLYEHLLVSGIDFKDYDYPHQREIIKSVIRDEQKSKIIADNKFLTHFPPAVNADLIEKNKNIIQINFSLENYAKQLYQMYR